MVNEVWIYVEVTMGEIELVSLELLGEGKRLAKSLGHKLCAVVPGYEISKDNLDKMSRYGAEKIYAADNQVLAQYNTEIYTEVITGLVQTKSPSIFLIGATPNGNDFAPQLAAKLGFGLVADCTDLKLNNQQQLLMTAPVFNEKAQATYICRGRPQIATVRPDVIGFDKPGEVQQYDVEYLTVTIDLTAVRTQVLEYLQGDPKTMDLEEAEIIIAGGRGVGDPDSWPLLEKLADVLQGSVGGSRMAMDLGFIDKERLIGQTGKTVRPKLYLAFGISGASHHLGGMEASEKVIAINKDGNAPIMRKVDLAVEINAKSLLPVLIKALQGKKSNKNLLIP